MIFCALSWPSAVKSVRCMAEGYKMERPTRVVVSYVHEVITSAVVGFADWTPGVSKTTTRGQAGVIPEAESCVSQTSQ